jgi:hypothetical protein
MLMGSALTRNRGTGSRSVECRSSAAHTTAFSGTSSLRWSWGYLYVPWWKMCRREKSLSVLCGCGEKGGAGRMGSSAALLTARNDSNREAVTRDAELQSGRRRMLWSVYKGVLELSSCLLLVKGRLPRWHASMTMFPFTRLGQW